MQKCDMVYKLKVREASDDGAEFEKNGVSSV